eukprot:1905964-Alexandrium_andersonii.AAC.1
MSARVRSSMLSSSSSCSSSFPPPPPSPLPPPKRGIMGQMTATTAPTLAMDVNMLIRRVGRCQAPPTNRV